MSVKQNNILVYNIPQNFRSKDLRRFFHHAIETKVFKCFHFRHRKSKYIKSKDIIFEPNTQVCVVKLMKESFFQSFFNTYNGRPWKEHGTTYCRIYHMKIITNEGEENIENKECKTINLDTFTSSELKYIQEMRPPRILLNGNVGAPLSHIMQLIKDCLLPTSLLSQLGIHLQNLLVKKTHTNIPWKYSNPLPNSVIKKSYEDIESAYIRKIDDEEEEEWDRYAKVHDDPYKLIPKERHYEQETEVVWEKGGPGLVWHMDLNYWEQFEEEAEREVDDWDVDFEELDFRCDPLYKDTYRTFHKKDDMKLSFKKQKRKFAYNDENKSQPHSYQNEPAWKSKVKNLGSKNKKVSFSEEYFNRFGSKILKKYGWEKGKGLGQNNEGIKEAILANGQFSNDKTGFGFKVAKKNR